MKSYILESEQEAAEMMDNVLRVDEHIVQAIDLWISHGIDPGSCTYLLLRGDYTEAFKHAHPLIKPFWDDHIAYVEALPDKCRGENMIAWKEKFKDKK